MQLLTDTMAEERRKIKALLKEKREKKLMVSNHPSSAQIMDTFVSKHGRFRLGGEGVGALEYLEISQRSCLHI